MNECTTIEPDKFCKLMHQQGRRMPSKCNQDLCGLNKSQLNEVKAKWSEKNILVLQNRCSAEGYSFSESTFRDLVGAHSILSLGYE